LREALSWPRSAAYVTIKSGCPSAVMLSACQQPNRNPLIATYNLSSNFKIISLPRYVLTMHSAHPTFVACSCTELSYSYSWFV
jgi:hypothetical protein